MAVKRPTFHESWYRVATLRPKLRASVQTFRQRYRGQVWHVVRDPAANQFFRLSEPAYHFVALLDGRRTVEQVWEACNTTLGDASPTQGEVIQALGQLYGANLLHADLPADAAGLFERYRKRVRKEITGYMSNLLFARIPLFDPEWILERWAGVVGWIFGPVGIGLWLALVATAIWHLLGSGEELLSATTSLFARETLLQPDTMLVLYLCFTAIKVFHEFGHGFACKHFGRKEGSSGDVHTMGIMLLVFMPVPYVDATSSWAFKSKWRRAFVGAAGMYVELAIAAIAAIVWAHTSPDHALHAIAYNIILIASITTLLFNGNPLLRYDGYYILTDLLETPNLYQRSKDYLYYLVRRYAYGVRNPRNPAHTAGERFWLPTYGVASFIYRVVVCVGIILFVADKLFLVGAIMAAVSVVMWVFVPLGKWIGYLATSPELVRTRTRAAGLTLAAVALLGLAVGVIPVGEHHRTQGVVEPVRYIAIHMAEDGFIQNTLTSGQAVAPDGPPLIQATNADLLARQRATLAQRAEAEAQLRQAQSKDLALAQALNKKIDALDRQLARLDERLAALQLHAPFAGTWLAPDGDRYAGAYVQRGKRLGLVASLDHLVIRALADQQLGPRVKAEAGVGAVVDVRVAHRPDIRLHGVISRISEAGTQRLPSPAFSTRVGGNVEVRPDDEKGATATVPHFEIRIAPDPADAATLHAGQRVVVRFALPPRPLIVQAWRWTRQLLQQRFQI